MRTPDQSFDGYVAMWSATDETRLRDLAEQALTEDAEILYPSFAARGRHDVVTTAMRFHQDNPGIQFELISGVQCHHGWVRGAWRMVTADGSSIHDGQTIIELADDGRVRRAIGFLDPLPGRL